jgi:hypothetical protein
LIKVLSQAIQYLSADYLPNISQTATGITKLVKDLAPYELTKAEKLQVVNLAPTIPVELYVVSNCSVARVLGMTTESLCQIVEELEDRLGDRMNEILSHVESSITHTPVPITTNGAHSAEQVTFDIHEHAVFGDMDEEPYVQEDIVFDDMGEGAGIEGDLDMDED